MEEEIITAIYNGKLYQLIIPSWEEFKAKKYKWFSFETPQEMAVRVDYNDWMSLSRYRKRYNEKSRKIILYIMGEKYKVFDYKKEEYSKMCEICKKLYLDQI